MNEGFDIMLTGRVTRTQETILDRLAEAYGLTRSQALRLAVVKAGETLLGLAPGKTERRPEATAQ